MYRMAIEHKGIQRIYRDNRLYKACRDIQNVPGGLILYGNTKYNLRLVAFWCEYDCRVKAGFGASEFERDQIANFYL